MSIGEVGNAEYFLLVVGNLVGQEGGARSAEGGGVFTGHEIAIATGAQSGTSFFMRLSEQDKVTAAADLRPGEFIGAVIDGQPVSGSFKC